MSKTAVIIVTHNAQKVLTFCLEAVASQSRLPDRVCIVDSGSDNTYYLDSVAENQGSTIVLKRENIGFSAANNLGCSVVAQDSDYLLFVNPDTLLERNFIEQASDYMDRNPQVGLVTGLLLGYDFSSGQATGRIDSTGIFRRWYGRWIDRGQGDVQNDAYTQAEDVPAACGALLFCRKSALRQAAINRQAIFDPQFFLYKEDIELCLRLRKKGWRIRYEPKLVAYHGRGWEKNRKKMPFELRKTAAFNELLLYRKHPSPYILWAFVKYFMVMVFRI